MNHTPASSKKSGFSSIRDFGAGFSRVTAYGQKINLLKAYLKENPKVKLADLADAVRTLDDKQICIEQGSRFHPSVTFFEKIGLSGKLAGIEREINRLARDAVKKMLSNNRDGKRFPEIVMGTLSPFVRKNEGVVLLRIAEQMNTINANHPVRKVHSRFIYNCTRAVSIVEQIKEEGINDGTIKSVFEKNKKILSGRAMRKVMQSYLLLDPCFKNHLRMLEDTLNALLDDDAGPDEDDDRINRSRQELAELAGVRDLDAFLKKSDVFVEAGGAYIDEITGLLDLLINAPLINILKLIKFPLNRQMFKKWIGAAPAPNGMSDEMERTILSVEQDMENRGLEYTPDTDPEKQLRLFYACDIGFTDKYKLLVESARINPEQSASCQFACRQIKDVQFKIENKFLETVISQLMKSFSFSEINVILENDEKKILARIADFKVHFKKNIDALAAKPDGKQFAILRSVVKHIADDKMLSPDAFIEVIKKVSPDLNPVFGAKLANSLIDFYFLLNAKLMLDLLKNYFVQIRRSDGVCFTRRLSVMTKEEIYGVMAQYRHEPEAVKQELDKYRMWGTAEQALRAQFVSRLGSLEFTIPEIQAGKFRLKAIRYGNTFTFQIIDRDNNTRFSKSTGGIATFLDFKNVIHRFKIDKYVPADENLQKTLFQYCHMDACRTIEEYIREHYELLTFPDSLLSISSQTVKHEVNSASDPMDKIDYYCERGESETRMRSALKSKYEHELTAAQKESPRHKRLTREIESQTGAIERIAIMVRFIERLGKKKTDITKLDVREIDGFVRSHRIGENNDFVAEKTAELETHLAEAGDGNRTLEKVHEYLKNMPQVPVLELDAPVVSEEVNRETVAAAMQDYILFHSVAENIMHLETIHSQCSGECELRDGYVKTLKTLQGQAAYYSKMELEYQTAALRELGAIQELIVRDLAQFREVEKLNGEADREVKKIAALYNAPENTVSADTVESALYEIKDPGIRCTAAAKLMITTDDERVEEQTVRVIEKSGVDRFKILTALYKVIDMQEDYEVKIKLVDDFAAYCAQNKPEMYRALKSLLDIQRERLVAEYEERKMKISDVWKMINENDATEDKIACINSLLENPRMRLYWPYLEQIRDGLLAENIEEFLLRNSGLPVSEQLELIKKLRIYGSEAYNIPPVLQLVGFKELELTARHRLYQPQSAPVFTGHSFSALERSRGNVTSACNAIDNEEFDRERSAVEEDLRRNNYSDDEIKTYLKRSMPTTKSISRFSSLEKRKQRQQKAIRVPQKEPGRTEVKKEAQSVEKRITPEKTPLAPPDDTASVKPETVPETVPPVMESEMRSRKEQLVKTGTTAETGLTGPDKKEDSPEPKERQQKPPEKTSEAGTAEETPSITFEEALMKLGTETGSETKQLVRRIELLIEDERIDEASELIETEAEKLAGEGAFKEMARFLSTCRWNDVVSNNAKTKDVVEQTLDARKPEIIKTAAREMPPPRTEASSIPVQNVKEAGVAGLVAALESLQKPTSVASFADACGFSEEELPRLKKIIPDLANQGTFIFIPEHEYLLGKGMLKQVIHNTFDEMMGKKTMETDPHILKAVWDQIRTGLSLDDQLAMIGASSREERSELLHELDQLLDPGALFRKPDPRKKAAAALRKQKKGDEPVGSEISSEQGQDRSHRRGPAHPVPGKKEKQRKAFSSGRKAKSAAKGSEKRKEGKYPDIARSYISRSYAPVISAYIKRMYRQKSDFFIPFEGRKQYYTKDVLLHAIEGILRKDISGNNHLDLLDSMKQDPQLFPLILQEMFEPYKIDKQTVYFPRFIRGKVEL